ncbi:hypothetical protein J6590_079566 [Homalodisca vitripennis]|nr:hypothetical protein J6590_079566 [Homalodisca vitripennis]
MRLGLVDLHLTDGAVALGLQVEHYAAAADCGQTEQSSVMTVVRQSGMIERFSEGSSSWSPGLERAVALGLQVEHYAAAADCGQTEQNSVMTVVRQSGMIERFSEGSSSWSPGRALCSCSRLWTDRQSSVMTVVRQSGMIERFSEGSSSWSPGRALCSCGRLWTDRAEFSYDSGRALCSCGRLWTDKAEFSYDSGKTVRYIGEV